MPPVWRASKEVAVKVVWQEGMFLVPQHFQVQDRYATLDARLRQEALHPDGYGLVELTFHALDLSRGTLTLERLRAVLPDGTVLSVPDVDEAPPARVIPPLPASGVLRVSIALAKDTRGKTVSRAGEQDGAPTRYREVEEEVEDEAGSSEPRRIPIGRRILRLLFASESSDGLVTLPLLDLHRQGDGTFASHPGYVAPSLHLAAAPPIRESMKRLHEVLSARASALRSARSSSGRGRVELTPDEVLGFWFLFTLNGAVARLGHVLAQPSLPLERAYADLVGIAGELSTFGEGASSPADLPPFSHAHPWPAFDGVDRRIRSLLEWVIPKAWLPIPLQKTDSTTWRGTIPGDPGLRTAQFFLSLTGELPVGMRGEDLPSRLKLGAAEDLATLVGANVRGVELQALPRPPVGVPTRGDARYFRVVAQGHFWKNIMELKTVALYIPDMLPGLVPDLMALKEA